jgi:hypothetical protein
MRNAHNSETAEVWSAAQHRRTQDLVEWLDYCLTRNDEMQGSDVYQGFLKPRLAFARGLTMAVITLAAVISVSAAVDTKRPPHVVLRSTGPMPAVNVP